jgi:hypothetical protein
LEAGQQLANVSFIEKLILFIGISRQIWRLGSDTEAVRADASQYLKAAGTRSWPRLRRAASSASPLLAFRSAVLLYEMGDEQGLWSLMDINNNRLVSPDTKRLLLSELRRIGGTQITACLETAIDLVEQGECMPSHWSVAVCLNALQTIRALGIEVENPVWRRLLTLRSWHDDTRVCRTFTPVRGTVRTLHSPTVSPSARGVAQIRRHAVDMLVVRRPAGTFELLKEIIGCDDTDVQLTAVHAMWRLGDRRAIVLLQPIAIERKHPYCREAQRAIASFGSSQPDEVTLVRASIRSESTDSLLRPAVSGQDKGSETLMRAGAADGLPISNSPGRAN